MRARTQNQDFYIPSKEEGSAKSGQHDRLEFALARLKSAMEKK
jgi:hypothetical protein